MENVQAQVGACEMDRAQREAFFCELHEWAYQGYEDALIEQEQEEEKTIKKQKKWKKRR